MWLVYVFEFAVIVIISIIWANGIFKTNENYPDYKGEDLFDENNP